MEFVRTKERDRIDAGQIFLTVRELTLPLGRTHGWRS
jgi:hypothetical protein